MQIVCATPTIGGLPFCADLDIDLGNPLQDLEGFAIHMGELIGGGATDHFDLRKKLSKGATKNYLYYDGRTGLVPISAGHGDHGGPQDLVADQVARPDDADDVSGGRGVARGHGRDRFVPRGIERLAERIDAVTPRPSSVARNCCRTSETPWTNGSSGAIGGGRERAVEVVEHLEERRRAPSGGRARRPSRLPCAAARAPARTPPRRRDTSPGAAGARRPSRRAALRAPRCRSA